MKIRQMILELLSLLVHPLVLSSVVKMMSLLSHSEGVHHNLHLKIRLLQT